MLAHGWKKHLEDVSNKKKKLLKAKIDKKHCCQRYHQHSSPSSVIINIITIIIIISCSYHANRQAQPCLALIMCISVCFAETMSKC